nr:hypothetical protein [Tanacetum cinerariifolium]
EIEDFKNKNKSLESLNNRFKEANNKLSETNKLMYNDFKKSQGELERRHDVEYASKEFEAHYMYMEQIQEVSLDAADSGSIFDSEPVQKVSNNDNYNVFGIEEVSPDAADFGPIFDSEPVQKVSTDDHYNVFSIKSEHPEQSEYVHDTYSIEQDEHNVIIDSLDMSYDKKID